MAHQRNREQKVDAFSAPKALLDQAVAEALRRGFTKSGFYRYCLAKEVGYSEAEAKQFAQHIGLTRALESLAESRGKYAAEIGSPSAPVLNEPATLCIVTEPSAPVVEKPPAAPPVKPSKEKPQPPTP